MRRKLSSAFIAKAPLPEKGDRTIYWDTEQKGLGLMVTKAGHRSYVIQYRNSQGVSRRMTPPPPGPTTLTAARTWAKKTIGLIAGGRDPLAEKRKAAAKGGNTLRAVAEAYFNRDGKQLRSLKQRRRVFERLIFPKFGNREIGDIKRSEIVKLLDEIEDGSGPRMAHLTLAYLSKLFNWHAGRHDDFRSPIVRGMGRINAKERARSRVLSDDELRAVWSAAEGSASLFDRYAQFLLLTGCRRTEAARMTKAELAGADWLIPGSRTKSKVDHLLPLSQAALDILESLPHLGPPNGFVFTHDGERSFGNFTRGKGDLQKRSGTAGWSIHDLRRTARTLMTRAGVPSDHAERTLGHALGGVRATYDRHSFHREKQAALEALAAQIERIVRGLRRRQRSFTRAVRAANCG